MYGFTAKSSVPTLDYRVLLIRRYHLCPCIKFSDFHLQFNFVGRILGPRGMTTKQLEQETGCKIMVRGKGSMRDKKKVSNLYLSTELK